MDAGYGRWRSGSVTQSAASIGRRARRCTQALVDNLTYAGICRDVEDPEAVAASVNIVGQHVLIAGVNMTRPVEVLYSRALDLYVLKWM